MSEFKIKVNVELNTDDLEGKLKALDGKHKIEVQLDMNKVNSQLKELKNTFKNAFKIDSSALGDISKVSNALENLTKTTKSTGKNSGINRLVNDYKELANMASKLEKQLNSGKLGNDSIDRMTASIINLKTQMGLIKNEAKQLGDSLSLSKMEAIDTNQFNKAMMDMHSYMNKIDSQADKIRKTIGNIDMSNLGDGSKAELNNILDVIEKIKNEAKDVRLDFDVSSSMNQLNDCYDTVKKIQNEAKEVGRSSRIGSSGLNGMFGTWNDFKSNFAQFTLAEMTGDFLADGIRRSFGFIKDTIVETDAAMTDLMKVAPESFSGTGKQLESYMTKVAEVAKGTGQTLVQTIQSNANALQVGFKDMDKAMQYAEKTSILANVGGLSVDDASSNVNGILAAYGGITNGLRDVSKEVKGATKGYTQMDNVLDQLNYSGNNFAVTTADIANVLSHSGSSLAAMGVDMQEAVGMGIAITEVLQNSDKAGNSLKSMSANMSGVIYSLKEGDVAANKSAKALEKLTGIKLFDEQTGEVLGMYDAMEQLNGCWDDLTEGQKSAVAQTIAGKTNLESFFALMSNWEQASKYVKEYNEGLTVGSAMAEKQYSPYAQKCA